MSTICNKFEIQTYLTTCLVDESSVLVWTKSDDEKEFYYSKAVVKKITPTGEVRLELQKEIPTTFNQDIFMAINDQNFVMKSHILSQREKKISISLPSMATGKERRRSPRKYYKFEDKVELTILLPDMNEHIVTYLLNRSEHGICIALSKESVRKILKSKKVFVQAGGEDSPRGHYNMRSLRLFSNQTISQDSLFLAGFEIGT